MLKAPPTKLLDQIAEISQEHDDRLLYETVRTGLTDLIDQHFVDGQKFWPESVLTERLNVSRVTVRRALQELSDQGTLHRFRAKGTFVQKSSQRRTQNAVPRLPYRFSSIGILMPSFQSTFWNDIVDELATLLSSTGRALHVYNTYVGESAEEAISQVTGSCMQEAILLLGHDCAYTQALYVALTDRGYRVVTIDGPIRDIPSAYVGVNNDIGVRMGMRYLTELGHRRIVMIVYEPPIHLPTQLRVNAFRSFVEEAGLSEASVKFADLSRNIGANNIVAKVLDETWETDGDKPTAIICDSDVSTLAALKWCGDHGIGVPHAVSIVGFDDTRSSRYSKPPLTTVAQPIAEIARKAVDLAEASEDVHILIAPTLIIRGTAAAPMTQAAAEEKRQ